jgi:acetyltransferase
VAKALIPVIYNSDKPVAITLMGDRLIQEAIEHFRAARIPEYRFPERAASALAILAQRADFLARAAIEPQPLAEVDQEKVKQLLRPYLEGAIALGNSIPLAAETINQILEAYGVPTLAIRLAKTAQEAVQLAEQVGFPVALKVASPSIAHKSDIGGVLLNLPDAEAVAQGFEVIVQNVRQAHPTAEIQGVYVQRMIPPGQEVIVGATQDEQFGALVMFGSGGVEVEALQDVGFALAPISDHEIEHLLQTTWAGRKLNGYRNLPPADRQAVIDVLRRIAQLAADFPQIEEIEINPLRVLEAGKGAAAVDVRARVKVLSPHPEPK